MGLARYHGKKELEEFVRYAKEGDKILEALVNQMLSRQTSFSGRERDLLRSHLNSGKFLSKIQVPFKYKGVLSTRTSIHVKADIVEAYVYWLKVNYGYKAAQRFIENQILTLTNN